MTSSCAKAWLLSQLYKALGPPPPSAVAIKIVFIKLLDNVIMLHSFILHADFADY